MQKGPSPGSVFRFKGGRVLDRSVFWPAPSFQGLIRRELVPCSTNEPGRTQRPFFCFFCTLAFVSLGSYCRAGRYCFGDSRFGMLGASSRAKKTPRIAVCAGIATRYRALIMAFSSDGPLLSLLYRVCKDLPRIRSSLFWTSSSKGDSAAAAPLFVRVHLLVRCLLGDTRFPRARGVGSFSCTRGRRGMGTPPP